MATNVDLFCTSCAKCQMNKDSTKRPIGLLHSLPVPEWPWQSIGMDFMGSLSKSDTHDYLLVVIDCLMSQVHLIPTNTCVMAKGVAWLFLRKVVCLHSVPDSIMSDRDTSSRQYFGMNCSGSWGSSSSCPLHSILKRMERWSRQTTPLVKYFVWLYEVISRIGHRSTQWWSSL
jgi:hypothetical protein